MFLPSCTRFQYRVRTGKTTWGHHFLSRVEVFFACLQAMAKQCLCKWIRLFWPPLVGQSRLPICARLVETNDPEKLHDSKKKTTKNKGNEKKKDELYVFFI